MATPATLAAPYLAVLSVVKLALVVLVFKEIGQAIMGSGDQLNDQDNQESGFKNPFKRKEEEDIEVEMEIIQPVTPAVGTFKPAEIQRKNNIFIARAKSGNLPRGGRYVWFINNNVNALKGGSGSYWGHRRKNLIKSKNVSIPAKYKDNEELMLRIRVTDSHGTRLVGQTAKRVIITNSAADRKK